MGNNNLRDVDDDEWSTTVSTTLRPTFSRQRHCMHTDAHSPLHFDNWEVKTLRTVPEYHPLEKSSIHVKGRASHLSTRISQFLRVNSICAHYDGDRVDCMTCERLKFVVRLWKGEDEDTVIVEVQRRQGCSVMMSYVRRALFRAVRSDTEISAPEQTSRRAPSSHLKAHMDAAISACKEMKANKAGEQFNTDACRIASNLMHSCKLEENTLGIESLASMTDPSSACKADAICFAELLLLGKSSNSELLRNSFVSYFEGVEHDSVGTADYDSDDHADSRRYAKGSLFGVMHYRSLGVLAKALEVLVANKDESSLKTEELDLRTSFWKTIVEALVYNVEVAYERPQEAAMSVKCIRLMMALAPCLQRTALVEDRLVPCLFQANEYGKVHHLILERESTNLMLSLAQAQ